MHCKTTNQINEYLENQIVDTLTINKTSIDENLEILKHLKEYIETSIEMLEKEKEEWD